MAPRRRRRGRCGDGDGDGDGDDDDAMLRLRGSPSAAASSPASASVTAPAGASSSSPASASVAAAARASSSSPAAPAAGRPLQPVYCDDKVMDPEAVVSVGGRARQNQAPMRPPLPSGTLSRLKPTARVGTEARGVRWEKSGRYLAHVKHKGKQIMVGTFDTIEEAIQARKDKIRKLEGLKARKQTHRTELQKVKQMQNLVKEPEKQQNELLWTEGMLQRVDRLLKELQEVKLPPPCAWEGPQHHRILSSSDSANERVPSSLFAAAPPEATNNKKRKAEDSRLQGDELRSKKIPARPSTSASSWALVPGSRVTRQKQPAAARPGPG